MAELALGWAWGGLAVIWNGYGRGRPRVGLVLGLLAMGWVDHGLVWPWSWAGLTVLWVSY
jgi:hypothetical protein